VFFRHDDDGGSALQAERLLHLLDGSSLASPVRSYDAAEGIPRGRGETIEP